MDNSNCSSATAIAPKSKRAIKYANDLEYRQKQIRYVVEYRRRKRQTAKDAFDILIDKYLTA